MQSYIVKYLVAGSILFAIVVGISFSAIQTCEANAMCALAHYRQREIREASPPVDTIFVGDSTLGFALDDRRFTQRRRAQTINLGTAGYDFGLPGAYSYVVQSLERFHPKNIIIMLTPQDFSQSISDLNYNPIEGFILTSHNHLRLLFSVDAKTSLLVLWHLTLMSLDIDALRHGLEMAGGKSYSTDCADCTDFFASVPDDSIDPDKVSEAWRHPTNDYTPFLEKISAICARESINCIYVHGTLLQKLCGQFSDYIDEISEIVEGAGIRVVQREPICVPSEDIGNSFNHVRPSLRGKYTDIIYSTVAPFLR